MDTARKAGWWEDPKLVSERWYGVFKGGGAKGVAYSGALSAAAEQKRWFQAVAGSSAGALTATLIAAGLTPEQIECRSPALLRRVRKNRIGIALGGASPVFSMGGVVQLLNEIIREQIRKYLGEDAATYPSFAELYSATGIGLYVVAMDLATSHPIVFSHITTPECQVAFAVAASSAIPVAFEAGRLVALDPWQPGVVRVHRIVDGGAWANYPAFVFKDESFRRFAGLPAVPPECKVVGFVLEQGTPRSLDVPWAFRPELETDEVNDLGMYVSSPRLRFVLRHLDKTRWRLLTFVFWPIVMCAATAFLLVRDAPPWDQLRAEVSGWIPLGRGILIATFVISATILVLLALGFYAFGRQLIRNGIGTIMAALSVSTNVPAWLGAAPNDFVVRVPVPSSVRTTNFGMSDEVRRQIVATAHEQSLIQIRRITQGEDDYSVEPVVRSTGLAKPTDEAIRPTSHLLTARFALGNWLLLTMILLIGTTGQLFDTLFSGVPINWLALTNGIFIILIPAIAGLFFYARGGRARRATRRTEQLKALERQPGEPEIVGQAQLLTVQKCRNRIWRRAIAVVLFVWVAFWYLSETRQDFNADTGTATVLSRTDASKHTFNYEVRINEGQGRGAGEVWRFGSHTPLQVGQSVRLRFVGGTQRQELAGDAPGAVATVVCFLGYLALINLIGVGWAAADRRWLLENPDMQPKAHVDAEPAG